MMTKYKSRLVTIGAVAAFVAAAPFSVPAYATQQESAAQSTTAQQQSNKQSDLEITRQIRRAIIKDKSLSIGAHNVTIITQAGKVIIKGRVKSEEEKQTVETTATNVAGAGNVTDQLTTSAAK